MEKGENMKIKTEDYNELKNAMEKTLATNPIMRYFYVTNGKTEERFRWDTLYYSGYKTSKLYEYLSDNHIDTALKKIIKNYYGY